MTDSLGAAAHAAHDTLLVASLVDHSLPPSERRAAEALVASCGGCAALHADLVALAAATRSMPTPTRPRDYTLSAETAARIRPSGWRRWVTAFGTSRDAFSRPLAVGLTTLGLAGLLVATVPSALQVGSATAPSAVEDAVAPTSGAAGRDTAAPEITGETTGAGAAPGAPSAAPAWAVSSAAPAPIASDRSGITIEPDGQTPAAGQGDTATGSTKGSGSGSGEPNGLGLSDAERTSAADDIVRSPMAVASIALLFLGLGLFALRRVSRRIAAG